MIQIEKSVEIPPQKKRGAKSKYPLAKMEVGDSFFVPAGPRKERSIRGSLSCLGRKCRPKKFIIRIVDDGVRCWRTE